MKMHQKDQEMRPQRVMAEDVSFRANEDPEELLLTPLKVKDEDPGFREEDPDLSTVKPTGELKPLRTSYNSIDEEGNKPEEKDMQLLPFRQVLDYISLKLIQNILNN